MVGANLLADDNTSATEETHLMDAPIEKTDAYQVSWVYFPQRFSFKSAFSCFVYRSLPKKYRTGSVLRDTQIPYKALGENKVTLTQSEKQFTLSCYIKETVIFLWRLSDDQYRH